MRQLVLISWLCCTSTLLFAQNRTVHFPQTVLIAPNSYTVNLPTSGTYSLLVEGGILTEKLRVASKLSPQWADYVLAPDYRLTPLNQVERFIGRHGHLPGIPSAQEVSREGIDVVQMQTAMMAKIEELTLHAIRQEKELKRLRRKVAKLTQHSSATH